MPDGRPVLTLAHSPDPDDAFMWWPITGKIAPDGAPLPGDAGRPVLDTGRFVFRALPADIEVLNRRAIERADLEITALSVRCYAEVRDRYMITSCGASFGDGFGPKIVCRGGDERLRDVGSLRDPAFTIAVPGRKTTAFLMLGLMLGSRGAQAEGRFIEMPFEGIIAAVAAGRVDAGLVIHEGQLTFAEAGLRLVADVGAWWKARTGLKLPLGINAVHRGLDRRLGAGSMREIGATLTRSVRHAVEHRSESTAYTLPFARANAARGGDAAPTLDRVDRYCRMYVSGETVEMGPAGRDAIVRVLGEGAGAGLCPEPGPVDVLCG